MADPTTTTARRQKKRRSSCTAAKDESVQTTEELEPRTKQKNITAEFLYFGLVFFRLVLSIPETSRKSLGIDHFQKEYKEWDTLECVIREDVKKLNSGKLNVEKSTWKANGEFKRLPIDRYVYVYQHQHHATFSSTQYSQLDRCDVQFTEERVKRLFRCKKHMHHDYFLPYFMDNDHLSLCYRDEIDSATDERVGLEELKCEYEQLQKVMRGEESAKDTPYVSPSGFASNWDENDWTKRLWKCIEKAFPQHQVSYTAEEGLHLERLLEDNLDAFPMRNCYIFQGAPDLIIHRDNAILGPGPHVSPDTESSSDDEVMENCLQQRPSLKGVSSHDLPEKLGELVAAIHCLLVSKILRKIKKGKSIEVTVRAKGILIDKIVGAVHCTGTAAMKPGVPVKVKFDILSDIGYPLTVESLCYHLTYMLNS